MRTPLFPANNAHITIAQGNVGDCYLLSALDCILTSGAEGYNKIKGLFTETPDNVVLRIKRNNNLYKNLLKRTHTMAGKYTHHYDANTNEDVFTISNQYLDVIDTDTKGVKTNSLAVKILERISTYYYEVTASAQQSQGLYPVESLLQHDRSDRIMGTSSRFVGDLLGIDTLDVYPKQIVSIMAFKTTFTNFPIYLSMDYGIKDQFNRYHSRHAYRLRTISENRSSHDRFEFVLVNPWNNTKVEIFSYKDIMDRNPRFCLFHLNPQLKDEFNALFTTPKKDIQAAQARQMPQTPPAPQPAIPLRRFEQPTTRADLIAALTSIKKQNNTEKTNTFVKDFKVTGIDLMFIVELIIAAEVSDAFMLFVLIHQIDTHNPVLAKKLFQITKDNLPSIFVPQMSFYDVSLQLNAAVNLNLKNWFADVSKPTNHIPGAQDIALFIEQLQTAIQTMVVSFDDCKNRADLVNKRCDLHDNLHEIIDEFAKRPGFLFPLSITELKQAHDQKRQSISNLAEARRAALSTSAQGVIAAYTEKLKAFNYSFEHVRSKIALSKELNTILTAFYNIRQNKVLSDAFYECDEQSCKTEFIKTYDIKCAEIKAKSEEISKDLPFFDPTPAPIQKAPVFFTNIHKKTNGDQGQSSEIQPNI